VDGHTSTITACQLHRSAACVGRAASPSSCPLSPLATLPPHIALVVYGVLPVAAAAVAVAGAVINSVLIDVRPPTVSARRTVTESAARRRYIEMLTVFRPPPPPGLSYLFTSTVDTAAIVSK